MLLACRPNVAKAPMPHKRLSMPGIGCHVKCFFSSDFNQNWNMSTNCSKNPKYEISPPKKKIQLGFTLIHAHKWKQTDRQM